MTELPEHMVHAPIRAKGNLFEDFTMGQVFEHHWGRTLTEADNVTFTTLTMNYCPLYFNQVYASQHGHSATLVSPMLVLLTAIGLSVEDLSEAGGPFLGIDDVRFHRPVVIGTTLTARSTVVALRESGSRPDTGIVTWHTEAHGDVGGLVIDYRRTNLVVKRDAGNS